jgi:ribosomal protein S12 methylthiotransferase accessory factor YcaO
VRETASARIHGRGTPYLVAEATLRAIARAIDAEPGFLLDDVSLTPSEKETVAVAVLVGGADASERLVGSASALDSHVAVSRAILSALNRRLGKTLARMLGPRPSERIPPQPDEQVPQR